MNRMKEVFATKSQFEEIARKYGTPVHIYDENGARENARKLYDAFSWNKGYKEYFAVKATPTPGILKILKEEGCGADCSSLTELMLSEKCGLSGSEIMFSSNETPVADMQKAYELGAYINLDDYTHVEFLKKVAGVPETVCCRYNPGGVFSVANQIMDNPRDAKYGMTKGQMKSAYRDLMAAGAKHFGIHAFHVSNATFNEYYPMMAKKLFKLAVELNRDTGAHIAFINLSGGIGVPYYPDQLGPDIYVIAEGVRKAYEEILVPAGMDDVKIFPELGRYMLAPYGCLLTKAVHEKHIYKEYIGVDACACDLMRPAMYGAYHHITVLGKENMPEDHLYDVVGSLCENNDKFAIDRELPEIDVGDLLVIHDTGAHGHAMGYNYNGKLRSPEVLLCEDGSTKLLRRRETPDDYFATMVF